MSEALIIAIHKKDLVEVKKLLEQPDIDLSYRYKPKSRNQDIEVTPLQFAASTGQLDIIQALLDKGADPLALSGTGRSRTEHRSQLRPPRSLRITATRLKHPIDR